MGGWTYHKDGTGHVTLLGGLVIVHVDALELLVGVADVLACWGRWVGGWVDGWLSCLLLFLCGLGW